MASIINSGKFKARDGNGAPYAGGKLYTYLAGSAGATNKQTFTDSNLGTPNANPVILDADGRADVWIGSGRYLFILKDSEDSTIWSVDNYADVVGDIIQYATVAEMEADSVQAGQTVSTQGYYAAGDGGEANYLVVVPQSFDGFGDHELANGNVAVLQAALGIVNVKQFGANGTTDSAAIQAAIDSTITSLATVYFPDDTYDIDTMVGFVHAARLELSAGAILSYTGADAAIWVRDEAGGSFGGEGFSIKGGQITGGGAEGLRLGRQNTITVALGFVEDMKITNMDIGINSFCTEVFFMRNVHFYNNGIGMKFANTTSVFHTTCYLDNCRFTSSVDEGVIVEKAWQLVFTACQFEANGKEGLKIYRDVATAGLHNLVINHCWFEGNNAGRAASNYGQLDIDNIAGTTSIDFLSIRDTDFAVPTTGNHQVKIAGLVSPIILSNNRYIDGVGDTAHGSITGGGTEQKVYVQGNELPTDWTLGTGVIFDVNGISSAQSDYIDVVNAAEIKLVKHFDRAAILISATLVYVEAASPTGLGGTLTEVGKRGDQNYYGTKLLASGSALWGISTIPLTATDVGVDDVVTFYSPNGLSGTGTGQVVCSIEYVLV